MGDYNERVRGYYIWYDSEYVTQIRSELAGLGRCHTLTCLISQFPQSRRHAFQLLLPPLFFSTRLDELAIRWGTHAREPALPTIYAPAVTGGHQSITSIFFTTLIQSRTHD